MYCPSCGKGIPDGSTFCLHCGTHIVASSAARAHRSKTPIEWEFKDFVIEYPPGKRGKVYIGPGGYTIPGGRLFFWQSEQASIAKKLQPWLDEGWEPLGEVGPSCYQVHTYRKWEPDFGKIITILFGILSLGIWLIASLNNETHEYMEVIAFRLEMRRPKA